MGDVDAVDDQEWSMWRLVLVVGGGLACACTTPNPRSCADGSCSDPALPFCDTDGAIGGAPLACIAVTCTPAEVAVCRGGQAVTCNSAGNDFDLVDCPLGCDIAVGGCRACATDNECSGSTPICDQGTSQCRGCSADSECESSVCGQGSCVDPSLVVYASPNGSSVATGTVSDPASISRAIVVATTGGTQKIVRLLPGAYSTPIEVLAPTSLPLEFVATGATISAPDVGVRVGAGATVKIRGLSATGGNQAVTCGANGDPLSALTIDDSVFFENMNVSRGSIVTTLCTLKLTNVESRSTSVAAPLLFLASGTRFTGDRLHLHGPNRAVFTMGVGVSVKLTNSVLDDVTFVFNTNDSQAPGSDAYIGFNTIVLESSSSNLDCASGPSFAFLTRVLENNIVVANSATSAISGTGCTLANNLLHPQPNPPAGNIVSDPQFIDSAARNFKLRPTSPALGAASATPTIFTDHDFEGLPRPQGSGADIGAFERP